MSTLKKNSLTTRVISGLGWAYLSTLSKAFSQILFICVLSRLLSPRDFGLMGMALVFTNIAERLAQLGTGPALIQREIITSEHIVTSRVVNLLLGVLVTSIVFFFAPLIAHFFQEPQLIAVLQMLSIIFIVESLCVAGESWLNRALKFRELALIENVSYIGANCFIAIPLALMGYGIWSLVYSQIAIRLIKYSLLFFISKPDRGFKFHFQAFKDLVRLGTGFSLGRLINLAAIQGDNLVVGKLLGAESLGLYSRIYQLMAIPATYLTQVLDRVLFPAMALRQAHPKKVGEGFLLLVEAVSMMAFPISVIVWLVPTEIIQILLGAKWAEANQVLQVFAIGVFFRAAYKCGDTVSRSMGAVYRYTSLQAVYAVCVIGGAIVGSQWGLLGVSWAVMGAMAINYLGMSSLAMRLTQTSWRRFLASHIPGFWIGIWVYISTLVVSHFGHQFGLSSIFVLGLVMMAAAVVICLCLLLTPAALSPRICGFLLRQSQFSSLNRRFPTLAKHFQAKYLVGKSE